MTDCNLWFTKLQVVKGKELRIRVKLLRSTFAQYHAKISNEIHNCIFSHRNHTMATQTSMLHIRVDDDIKEQATLALTAMGLSVSDAVRLFLRRVVVDQAFPLELKVPNADTQAAMDESCAMMARRRNGENRFASADEMFADLEKNSVR